MDGAGNPDAKTFKVIVMVQRRPGGGLRVWSDDVPGLVLSHKDPEMALANIAPVLEVILGEMLGHPVKAEEVRPVASVARRRPGLSWPFFGRSPPRRLEYSASPRAA